MTMNDDDLKACFRLFDGKNRVVMLTGAGVSTLSGIPDFRGKNGIYRKLWHGVSPETLLEIGFFRRNPEMFYRYAADNLYPMLDKTPSIAHTALARLQQSGRGHRLYTQNIDGLHTKAGAETGELHGTLLKHRCMDCGRSFPVAQIRADAEAGKVPRCRCGGLVKPEVVFYGENLDDALLNRAFEEFEAADAALVLGSSLTVSPVSSLPAMTLRGGGKLIIVNDQPTVYDAKAAFRFDDIASFCESLQTFLSPAEH